MLLMQYIRISWNKECRGGKGAVQRSNMKQAEMLSEDFFDCIPFGYPCHYVYMEQDKDGFHTKLNRKEIISETDCMHILLCPAEIVMSGDDDYSVRYRYDFHRGAKPPRYRYDSSGSYTPINEEAFVLHSGDYGRMICNGRFVDIDTGDWWYEMDILNIRIISSNTTLLDCFLSQRPTHNYKQTADLR